MSKIIVLRTLDDCNREVKLLLKKSIDQINPEDLPSFHAMLCASENQTEKEQFEKDLGDLIARWASYSQIRNLKPVKIITEVDLTESDHNPMGRP